MYKHAGQGFTQSCFSKGFTLIELLVAVLIIGILAAIAVPKYKLAVDKTRWLELLQMERNLSKAQELFYLSNGKYASSFDELDISYEARSSDPRYDGKYYQHGDLRAMWYGTEVEFYRRKDSQSPYLNVGLITGYYSSPKRVIRQCRPVNGSLDELKLCKDLIPEGTVDWRGWVVLE